MGRHDSRYPMPMRAPLSVVLPLAALHSVVLLGQPPAPASPAQAPPRAAAAIDATPPASGRLPVKRVVLYKSGVGYFEHLGRITGSQSVAIDLTSGQLDDVL